MAFYPGQAAGPAGASVPPRDEIVRAELGDALKRQEKPDWKSKSATPKNIFLCVGCVLLMMLSIVPVWNAIILMTDSNYVFWAGRSTPKWMIGICVGIVLLYAITISIFFRKPQASQHTEQTVMMVANIFITLFGLFLMMASLPLTHQAELTHTNLLHRCDHSEQTQRLREYSQVLQNIRATPACATKYSVEECAGFEQAAPYTTFLKGMENNFHCAGFCYAPATVQMAVSGAAAPGGAPGGASPAPAAAPTNLLSTRQHIRHRHTDHMTKVSLIAEGAKAKDPVITYVASAYPPTLFSDMNFQASCEGMAARDMKSFAGDIGQQTFYQGIYLVLIAVMTGFLKLMGFCVRKA